MNPSKCYYFVRFMASYPSSQLLQLLLCQGRATTIAFPFSTSIDDSFARLFILLVLMKQRLCLGASLYLFSALRKYKKAALKAIPCPLNTPFIFPGTVRCMDSSACRAACDVGTMMTGRWPALFDSMPLESPLSPPLFITTAYSHCYQHYHDYCTN